MGFLWGDDERLLASKEQALIRKVFRTASLPPMSQIRIRNGLSANGTAFTTPRTAVKIQGGFPIETEGEYLIMVGQRLFDGDVSVSEPATLVHEMTHVWQYKHRTLTEAHAATAHVAYAALDKVSDWTKGRVGTKYEKLYGYDIGQSWNDMGFEGQAQMVEEWFALESMDETSDRWMYIKNVMMAGDIRSRSMSLIDMKLREPVRSVETVSDERTIAFEEIVFSDDYLIRLFNQVIAPTDVKRLAARVATLEAYMRQLKAKKPSEAASMAQRLLARSPKDKLATTFHQRLSTPTRDKLVRILQGTA